MHAYHSIVESELIKLKETIQPQKYPQNSNLSKKEDGHSYLPSRWGGSVVVLNVENCKLEALHQLGDSVTYCKLDFDPTEAVKECTGP